LFWSSIALCSVDASFYHLEILGPIRQIRSIDIQKCMALNVASAFKAERCDHLCGVAIVLLTI
jgi:hypothetical protein